MVAFPEVLNQFPATNVTFICPNLLLLKQHVALFSLITALYNRLSEKEDNLSIHDRESQLFFFSTYYQVKTLQTNYLGNGIYHQQILGSGNQRDNEQHEVAQHTQYWLETYSIQGASQSPGEDGKFNWTECKGFKNPPVHNWLLLVVMMMMMMSKASKVQL